jgi:hypothetical protein
MRRRALAAQDLAHCLEITASLPLRPLQLGLARSAWLTILVSPVWLASFVACGMTVRMTGAAPQSRGCWAENGLTVLGHGARRPVQVSECWSLRSVKRPLAAGGDEHQRGGGGFGPDLYYSIAPWGGEDARPTVVLPSASVTCSMLVSHGPHV